VRSLTKKNQIDHHYNSIHGHKQLQRNHNYTLWILSNKWA